MCMLSVGHIRSRDEHGIICDRTTALGNPYTIGIHNREYVIRQYRVYFETLVHTFYDPTNCVFGNNISPQWIKPSRDTFLSELAYIAEMREIDSNLKLLCWCFPKACHCDIIAEHFNTNKLRF
jgi:hypothetical protein